MRSQAASGAARVLGFRSTGIPGSEYRDTMNLCLANHSDVPRTGVFTSGRYPGERGHHISVVHPSGGKRMSAKWKIDGVPFPARFVPRIHCVLPGFRRQYQRIHDLI